MYQLIFFYQWKLKFYSKNLIRLFIFLLIIHLSYGIQAQVLINEVVTNPQVDWSTNGFDGTDGLGIIDSNDEWIELYITTNGLDLTGWTIELNDGTNTSGSLTAGGAFVVSNYVSGTGGLFTDTDVGDYLVIGQPVSGSMDATITVVLRDNTSSIIDQVEIAAGSGTFFTAASSGITDECVCRIPNGTDTNNDATDFVLTQSTLGANNSPSGIVLINEVITDPQQDWSANGFDGTIGGITVTQGTDEWIELYIGTNGLNLTKWVINVADGTPFSGDLTSRNITGTGAFQEIMYFGSGSFTSTVVGDYLVLGNPQGIETMSNEVTITLTDSYGSVVDIVEIAAASGTGFDGNATGVDDESICRIPNGQDTNVESNDFVQTRATLGANNSPQGVVLINEIVTDPQQDWSSVGFASSAPGGIPGTNDEWIELYIGTSGLNLIKWNISVVDGTDFSGDLTTSGAFTVVNYVGSGSFNQTVAGDYLILGNPVGTEQINDDVYIALTDPYGTVVDDVEIGDDPESDGAGDGASDGSASGGASATIADEAIFRVPLAQDTDNDVADFRKGLASLGAENGLIYVDASVTDDTGFGRPSDPKQLIQSGINIAVDNGRVIVAAGTYSENLTITKPLFLEGANIGVAGNGSRSAETINDVSGVGITITADTVTIDGIQLGTNATTSSITNGIVANGYTGITIQNNVVYTNSIGIVVGSAGTSRIIVDNNVVSMLAIEDATNLTNGSIGIAAFLVSGDADLDLTNNDIANASIGISSYGLQSSTEAIIDGGNYTGCMTGILPSNTDGGGGFFPSSLTIQNITMSGFATDPDVTNIDTETAVYAFTAGGTTTDDITVTIRNLDVSGVGNDLSNYSGIVIGDFPSASDGAGIDATIVNCNVHDNENRGIYVRGGDAVASVSQSTISGNGFNPTASGGNPGFSVIVREGATASITSSFITNPASLSAPEDIPNDYYVSGFSVFTGGALTVSGCNLNRNGNGFIAETVGVDLSGNYFNTVDEATIQTLVGTSNDYTPWLESGTDTDGSTPGFQADMSALTVAPSGAQTAGNRVQEGHDLVDVNGTITLLSSTYTELFTVSKDVSLNPAAGTTIDDITLNGGRLNVLADLEIINILTLTNGILDIDLDDGNKNDDPMLTLNNAVLGSFDNSIHIEGIVQVSIGGGASFDFPVGDTDSYRPVTLTPTNAATFNVSHNEEATAIGGGASNPNIINLIGDASTTPSGTVQSVMNFRYWTINVASGAPGSTDVALEIYGGDRATDPTSLGMTRFDGSDWLLLPMAAPATGTDPYLVTAQTSSFSDFSIFSTDVSANPLPVELVDFRGKWESKGVKLTWATLSEVNSQYFEIEKSRDTQVFHPIVSLASHGNSSRRHEYTFLDEDIDQEINYYRLRMVDYGGDFNYSSIIQVNTDFTSKSFKIFPNPVLDFMKIEGIDLMFIDRVEFFDISGKLHKQLNVIDNPLIYLGDLDDGYFMVRVNLMDGRVMEGKVIKK